MNIIHVLSSLIIRLLRLIRRRKHPHRATAADIPPELFERIIAFLGGEKLDHDWRNDMPLEVSKSQLGVCSLTCKYWAVQCRRRIFRRLTLRSHEDITTLHGFVEATKEYEWSIARFLNEVELEYRITDPPWIHHLYVSKHLLPVLSPYGVHITLWDDEGNSKPPNAMLGVHHLLPRPIPPSLSLAVHVDMRDIHFRNFEQIAKISASVYYLDTSPVWNYRRLTWDGHQPDFLSPPRYHCPFPFNQLLYHIEECSQSWLFLRLVVTTRTSRLYQSISFVDPSDFRRLESIARCVTETSVCGPIATIEGAERRRNCGIFDLNRTLDLNGFRVTVSCGRTLRCSPDCTVHVLPSGIIDSITVTYHDFLHQKSGLVSDHSLFDYFAWAELDTLASQLTTEFRSFVVDVITSEELLATFSDIVKSKMPHMVATGKLQFMRKDPVSAYNKTTIDLAESTGGGLWGGEDAR